MTLWPDATNLAALTKQFLSSEHDDQAFVRRCAELDEWFDKLPSSTRQLRRVLRHSLFLLRDGDRLSDRTWHETSPQGTSFYLEAILHSEDGVKRITAEVATYPKNLSSAPKPFDAFVGLPSVLCWVTAVNVRALPESLLKHVGGQALHPSEYRDFFGNQQTIRERIPAAGAEDSHAVYMRDRADAVRAEIERLYASVEREACIFRAGDTATHPVVVPTLHILPRLVLSQDNLSVMRSILQQLPRVADMGFGAVLLGVVDPQTVGVYYGELGDSSLSPACNDHGYWSTGESGIDTSLGTLAEYRELVCACRELGLQFLQDSVFGSLGYPAQILRFSASALQSPLSCVVLGSTEVDVADPVRFIHDGSWIDGNGGRLESDFLEEIALTQLGTCWALPKPNLFKEDVFFDVLARALFQAREANVNAFRVDMAKHIPTAELRRIISHLRGAHPDSKARFVVLLEYLTSDYRALNMALTGLEDELPGCYMYDFPLAAALHRIFVGREQVFDQVNKLLSERTLSGIPLRALVPTFIDHDTVFPPIYTGDQDTQAAVVAGYALALMVSANYPVVYMGFSNAASGISPGTTDRPNNSTRHTVTNIFDDDPMSPSLPVASLFKSLASARVLEQWDSTEIYCEEMQNGVRIHRQYFDTIGNLSRIDLVVSAGPANVEMNHLIFTHDGTYSVRIGIRRVDE
ncbi:alpha-amylase family glycosyl hydrolase [Massilia sp. TWP1-3-3]|uniref:alpha-amylase family glycosyl hydrolase n=1 Tax=Massilia sp. TWP1-3-3 TaxID=2804573 RepID=UPI003CE7BCB3